MFSNFDQPVLILGANGQVGSALHSLLKDAAIVPQRTEADLSRPSVLSALFKTYKPCAVINAAAYTQVDKAESEPDAAHTINADAPGVLARECALQDIPFVHYSTDYVFDGSGNHPWQEDDTPHPLSVYGKTKRAGEEAVVAAGGKYLILRTSWVYDATGKNFLTTMLKYGAERETLRVVNDQHGAPTYAPHLAEATLKILNALKSEENKEQTFPSGIYHLCNAGETTWHGFAEAIFARARAAGITLTVKQTEAIPTRDYPTPAVRPLNSRLDCTKAKNRLGVVMPDWQEGLKEAIWLYSRK